MTTILRSKGEDTEKHKGRMAIQRWRQRLE